jgi:hypothetical protein
LNGLTLAVETAAIYLGKCDRRVIPANQRQHAVEITGYLPQLRADLDSGGSGRNESQLREVTATLRPTLARLDAPARTVLQIAALLAPDGIALPWVRTIASLGHPELADDAGPGASDPWTELIRSLLGMRIFHPTPEPRVVATHRILQRVLESEVTEEREVLGTRLLECIRHRAAALEKVMKWDEARWELDPLEALAWLWAEPAPLMPGSPAASATRPQPPARQDAAWLLNYVGLRATTSPSGHSPSRSIAAPWPSLKPASARTIPRSPHTSTTSPDCCKPPTNWRRPNRSCDVPLLSVRNPGVPAIHRLPTGK